MTARTNFDVPKHRAMSLFIVDMKSPGISLTQVPTVAGWAHHAVYLDYVRVPRDMLVGMYGVHPTQITDGDSTAVA